MPRIGHPLVDLEQLSDQIVDHSSYMSFFDTSVQATDFFLSKRLNLPTKIRELGIPKKACKEMSIEAMKQERLLINNPIGLTQKDIQKIYEQAW